MIDFSSAVEVLNSYKGSEKKKALIYNDKRYLVKFPDPIRQKKNNISYITNSYSEYIGSKIFEMIGFKTQDTILGTYTYHDKKKIVCACEDFTSGNHVLYEFENLALSFNPDKKIDTELSDVLEVIDELKNMPNIVIDDDIYMKFWDMFVVDFLIGNTDRHNGNWGLLVNTRSSKAEFSPIYDCGSCLNPLLEDEELKNMKEAELKNLAMNCYSCLKENNHKIQYVSFITGMKNEYCNKAVIRVFPKININDINSFIDDIELLSVERRNFYKNILNLRYDILKKVYEKLNLNTFNY